MYADTLISSIAPDWPSSAVSPDGAGREGCRAFCRIAGRRGLVVVSGLALGIDAAARRGALSVAGPTVAIIGTGCDRIYPARNQALAQAIDREGAIVSEFPLGTSAVAHNFPRRNRLISGLSRGVLVVEAAIITCHDARFYCP